MSQNWCSGDSRTLAQSRLWLLDGKVPGTFESQNLPGTLTSRNIARTHCSQNLSLVCGTWVPGTCPEPWFPEPWFAGTLPRNPGSRNRFSEPWVLQPVVRGGRVEQCRSELPEWRCGLWHQSILLLGKKCHLSLGFQRFEVSKTESSDKVLDFFGKNLIHALRS